MYAILQLPKGSPSIAASTLSKPNTPPRTDMIVSVEIQI